MNRGWLTLALAALLVMVWSAPVVAQVSDDEILKWFQAGMDHAFGNKARGIEKNNEEAGRYFEKVLAQKPNWKLCMVMREKVGVDHMTDLLSRGGETRSAMLYLLKRTHSGYVELQTSQEKIVDWVTKAVKEPNFHQRWRHILLLDAHVGPLAVPHTLQYLRMGKESQEKVRTILLLKKLGRQAVLPLIRCLDAADSNLLQNVAITLGLIGDDRAVPALKRLIERNTGEEVQKYAREALLQITRDAEVFNRKAQDLYLAQGERYYQDDPTITEDIRLPDAIWEWNPKATGWNKKLTIRHIPSYLFNDLMTEELCFEALRVHPSSAEFTPAWALLISGYFAQYIKTSENLLAAKFRHQGIEQSAKQLLEINRGILQKIDAITLGGGLDILYAALAKSIKDRRTRIAVASARALARLEKSENQPRKPLLDGLGSQDKQIRYACAEALVHINPKQPFPGWDKVVPTLENGLGESSARVILVITSNISVRNEILTELNKVHTKDLHFAAYSAGTGASGLDQARRFPAYDAIMLDTQLGPRVVEDPTKGKKEVDEYFLDILHMLRDDWRTRHIPVILLVRGGSEYRQREALFVQARKEVSDIIDLTDFRKDTDRSDPKDKTYVKKLDRLFLGIKDDFRNRSLQLSILSANALAAINPAHSIFKPIRALGGLIETLKRREDAVRIPSCRALGNIGSPRALKPLLDVFRNTAYSVPLRVEAALAMGSIYEKNRMAPGDEAVIEFTSALGRDINKIHTAVSIAIGKSAMPRVKRLEIFFKHRVRVKPKE